MLYFETFDRLTPRYFWGEGYLSFLQDRFTVPWIFVGCGFVVAFFFGFLPICFFEFVEGLLGVISLFGEILLFFCPSGALSIIESFV